MAIDHKTVKIKTIYPPPNAFNAISSDEQCKQFVADEALRFATQRIAYLEAEVNFQRKEDARRVCEITRQRAEIHRLQSEVFKLLKNQKTIPAPLMVVPDPIPLKEYEKTHRYKIWNLTGGRCFFCNIDLPFVDFTIDHLVPVSKRGRNNLENKVPSCSRCNGEKGNRLPTQEELDHAANLHGELKNRSLVG